MQKSGNSVIGRVVGRGGRDGENKGQRLLWLLLLLIDVTLRP